MTTKTSEKYPRLQATKPHGGFVFLTVLQLCLLWWLYRTRYIRLYDYRVWHACHEMVARRCQLAPGQRPAYTLAELHTLVGGVGGEHLRASLRRLEALALLTWSSTAITFVTSVEQLRAITDLSDFYSMLTVVEQSPDRRVPMPRQTLRLIASGCALAVIATMLGHLVRCLYYHPTPQHCTSGGWCKTSWIADVFRVNSRNIKAARRHLATLGWLHIFTAPQRTLNRWGSYIQISLTWDRSKAAEGVHTTLASEPPLPPDPFQSLSPPPPTFSPSQTPPPSFHKEPLQDSKHQQPIQEDPPSLPEVQPPQQRGSSSSASLPGVQQCTKTSQKTTTTKAPALAHILPEDLTNTERLLRLFTQAHEQGLIGKSESHRLTFLAIAEHALVIGSTNPCGLFAELIRRQRWDFVTQSDEDAALRRLKQYLYGESQPRSSERLAHTGEPPALSPDAAIVRYIQTQLGRQGFHGEVFNMVHREDPLWTRERWDTAVLELENARHCWKRANDLNRLGSITEAETCWTSVVPAMADSRDESL